MIRAIFIFVATALALACCASTSTGDVRFIAVSGAPAANGPYSQGVVANGFLFTAGFTPRDPTTNNLVPGDITVLTNRVLDNLEAVLKGAGCSFKDVVKVTVYMTDLNEFSKMNEVMAHDSAIISRHDRRSRRLAYRVRPH